MRSIASSELVKSTIAEIWPLINQYACAIYLGGSQADDYIKNNHDIDYIIYVPTQECKEKVLNILGEYFNVPAGVTWRARNTKGIDEGFSIIRVKTIRVTSYQIKLSILLAGEESQIPFDIINNLENRDYYRMELKRVVHKLDSMDQNNNFEMKRWYRVYRGLHVYKNKTYKLSPEEIVELNILHDQKEEDKELRQKLIEQLRIEVNNL